jgi:NTE family protein
VSDSRQFSLVLGGGGLKGLAHIGVLRALEERGLSPGAIVGTSIGALVAGGYSAGEPVDALWERALLIERKHVFQIAHADMAFRRMLSPAVYRREPLDTLIHSLVGARTFRELGRRLLVNTADLNSGMQVLWGSPGLDDIQVAEAIFASCALPGIFPPREIRGRWYMDGAVVESLPIRQAGVMVNGPVVAVDLGGGGALREGVERQGFAATYARGFEIVMGTRLELQALTYRRPPVLLVAPRLAHVSMFGFADTGAMLQEGYRATLEALDQLEAVFERGAIGLYPRRRVVLSVDREHCIGCRACVARAPDIFQMDDHGKATVLAPEQVWSPFDGSYVRNCPTWAIKARPAAPV